MGINPSCSLVNILQRDTMLFLNFTIPYGTELLQSLEEEIMNGIISSELQNDVDQAQERKALLEELNSGKEISDIYELGR